MQIKEIMSRDVVTISSNESVAKAALKMRDRNVGTIAVIEGDKLVGLLNDRQITVGVVAAEGSFQGQGNRCDVQESGHRHA